MMSTKQLQITLVKSVAGKIAAHKACIRGLGLRRLNHSVVVENNPCIQGMIRKVAYLLKIVEV